MLKRTSPNPFHTQDWDDRLLNRWIKNRLDSTTDLNKPWAEMPTLARGNGNLIVWDGQFTGAKFTKGSSGPSRSPQGTFNGEGHINDDFLLTGILLTPNGNEVGATSPANPARNIKEH
jgi:hypothetical protein